MRVSHSGNFKCLSLIVLEGAGYALRSDDDVKCACATAIDKLLEYRIFAALAKPP